MTKKLFLSVPMLAASFTMLSCGKDAESVDHHCTIGIQTMPVSGPGYLTALTADTDTLAGYIGSVAYSLTAGAAGNDSRTVAAIPIVL